MKSILSPIQTVNSILGEQKQRENTVYRETRHRVALPCEDGQLLFHTLTQELLLLESGETGETCRDELIKHWFLVPRDFDECRQADGVRQVAKLLKQPRKERTNFTILTTTDCNARCFYCYEKGIRRYAMTPETARDVGEYIVRVSEGEKVRISWFGGEPLYNPGVIDIICEVLRENGVAYSAIMTSNGYLLDA